MKMTGPPTQPVIALFGSQSMNGSPFNALFVFSASPARRVRPDQQINNEHDNRRNNYAESNYTVEHYQSTPLGCYAGWDNLTQSLPGAIRKSIALPVPA
jgi:hypothetical protein